MNLMAWRYKRFHVSYVLAWFSLGLLGGLVLGRNIPIDTNAFLLITILVFVPRALRYMGLGFLAFRLPPRQVNSAHACSPKMLDASYM